MRALGRVEGQVSPMAQTGSRGSTTDAARELPVGIDARSRMLEFYRERDRQDAARCADGQQRGRGGVYALGIARLESGEDVYESYQVLSAAGIELPEKVRASIAALSRDWRFVCRIDGEGRAWTASLREKNIATR